MVINRLVKMMGDDFLFLRNESIIREYKLMDFCSFLIHLFSISTAINTIINNVADTKTLKPKYTILKIHIVFFVFLAD